MRKRRLQYLLEKENDAGFAQGVKVAGQLYELGRSAGGISGIVEDEGPGRLRRPEPPTEATSKEGSHG